MRHRLDLLAQSDSKFPVNSATDDVKRSNSRSPFGSLFYMVFQEPGAYDASRFGPSGYIVTLPHPFAQPVNKHHNLRFCPFGKSHSLIELSSIFH